MTTLFIDVSHHDWDRHGGQLDWGAIRAATSPVMIARATYGDPSGWNRPSYHFGDFQAGARAAGFATCGGYHNLVRGDAASIARQVDALRRELDRYGCVWAMADVEPYPELVSAGMWPRREDVLRWHDRWYAVDDRVMAWYIPQWFWATREGPDLSSMDLRGLRGPLIQSHYAGGDGTAAQIYAAAGGDHGTGWDDAYGGRTPDIWQYTSNGNVAGASSQTDCNAYRGTLTELVALITGSPMAAENGDTMLRLVKQQGGDGTVWLADGITRRPLKATDVADVKYVCATGQLGPLYKAGEVGSVANLDAYGVPAAEPAAVDPAVLAAELLAQSGGHVTVTIGDDQLERVVRKVLGGVDGATPPEV